MWNWKMEFGRTTTDNRHLILTNFGKMKYLSPRYAMSLKRKREQSKRKRKHNLVDLCAYTYVYIDISILTFFC